MTTDLWMLVATVALTWVLIMGEATLTILAHGPVAAGGNREDLETPEDGLHGRMKRLVANILENLPLFASLVLVAHVSGQADSTSALGAQIFVGARVVHAGLYIAGIPMARTVVWMVSIAGMMMVGASLVS